MMAWIIDLWREDVWYQQLYIISAAIFILCSLLSLCMLRPYSKVAEEIEIEYASYYSKHFL